MSSCRATNANAAESLKFRYKLAQNIKVECARRSLMTSDLAERIGMTKARISDIVHSNGTALAHGARKRARDNDRRTNERVYRMNRVMLLGHLLEDPRTRTAGQYQVTSLWIETREEYKDRNKETKTKTQKHTVEVWGARSVLDQLRQGSLVLVEGSLETSSYDKNGEKRWKTVVKATNIRCLDQQSALQDEEPNAKWGEEPPDDSDLPF